MKEDKPVAILSAEDDDDHFVLIETALEEFLNETSLQRVCDGEELMEYLKKEGGFASLNLPKPDLLLLDLNMPRKNGINALKEINENQDLAPIRTVIFTVSSDEKDIEDCYRYGACSFVTKPADFQKYIATVKQIYEYWVHVSQFP